MIFDSRDRDRAERDLTIILIAAAIPGVVFSIGVGDPTHFFVYLGHVTLFSVAVHFTWAVLTSSKRRQK